MRFINSLGGYFVQRVDGSMTVPAAIGITDELKVIPFQLVGDRLVHIDGELKVFNPHAQPSRSQLDSGNQNLDRP